jgi:F-type H+-transporting ATPase subunit b
MSFDWWTLLLQIVNFLILVWLLWRFLYKPVQAVLAKRREMAGAALAAAEAKQAEAEAEAARLKEAQAKLDAERQSLIEDARKDAEAKRQSILEDAQKQAQSLIAEARNKAAKDREGDVASLKKELAETAVDIARRILTQTADGNLNAFFRSKILQSLDTLDTKESGAVEGTIRVATAEPLADSEAAAWREALARRYGDAVKAEFVVDPELVAGAELQLPHGHLRFAWADELKAAGRLLMTSEAAE